jgi:hypothetical protein
LLEICLKLWQHIWNLLLLSLLQISVIICCVSEKYVKSPNCNREVGTGIRGGKVIICCVSEKYVKSPDCNREVDIG